MATLCLLGLFSIPAQAVIITVGGVDYDVRYFTNGFDVLQPNFNDNLATLTDPASAPWWGVPLDGLGGTIDARDFAEAYDTQVGGAPNVSSDPDFLRFAYALSGNVTSWAVQEFGVVVGSVADPALGTTRSVFAYTVPIPAAVPEIDGNALAKALFILFALGAWLHTRRARAA